MRGFLIVAVGAAALAGCAPFEHGHYASDVKYMNSNGDPAGTPLVFHNTDSGFGDSTHLASTDDPSYRATDKDFVFEPAQDDSNNWSSIKAANRAPVQPSYSAPVQQISYAPTAAQQPVYIPPQVQPAYMTQTVQPSYAPTASYSAPVAYQPSFTPPVQMQQPVVYAQPRYAPASVQTFSATSLGGVQIDAEGFAICNESYPQGAQLMRQMPQMPHRARGLSNNY